MIKLVYTYLENFGTWHIGSSHGGDGITWVITGEWCFLPVQ